MSERMKNQPRILIVEDEPAIAELIAVNLRHNGFEVRWPADGDAGAARDRRACCPTLILLDWMLPGQSGLRAGAPLARRPAHQRASRSSC